MGFWSRLRANRPIPRSDAWKENMVQVELRSEPRPRTEPPAVPVRRSQPGKLFDYGGNGNISWSSAPLAVIDVETTGLSPQNHRVVEIAISRIENGSVVDEWSSIVNPGCDPGPTWIHAIAQKHLDTAPALPEVIGEVLSRMDGAIIVAHNASFEEGFLKAEFTRMGLTMPTVPAVCTLHWSRAFLSSPNHKLETCCTACDIPLSDAHTALGDVRATSGLITALMQRGAGPQWATMPTALPTRPVTGRPRTRATKLRKGQDGWMASILSKLPLTAAEPDSDVVEAYFAAVAVALEDGKIIGDEAKMLATLAGEAGMGAAQVAHLNQRILDGLREAALADNILTATELLDLKRAAVALAVPDYFKDLTAD